MKERKKVNENKKETKCTSKIRAKGNGVEVVAPRWRPINGVVSRRRSDPMPAFDESQASKKPKRKKNNKNNNNNHKKKTATAQQKTSRAAQIDHRTSLEATPFFFNLNSSLFIQNIFRCPAPGKRGANPMACTNFPSGIKTHKFSKIGNFDQKSCTYHHMCSEIKMSFIFRSDLIFDK